MEPWDGPAAVVATDSRWVVAGHGPQRPQADALQPYGRDGLLVVGSETGMVPHDARADIVEKGRLGPGETIGVDLRDPASSTGMCELKDYLAGLRSPIRKWVENITHLDDLVERAAPSSTARYEHRDELRSDVGRRCSICRYRGYGADPRRRWSLDAKEPLGSMGDDTPAWPCSPGNIAACTTILPPAVQRR